MAMFRVTIRNEQDEVMEFDSSQPVLHIDVPAGRYLITVSCAGPEGEAALPPVAQGSVH